MWWIVAHIKYYQMVSLIAYLKMLEIMIAPNILETQQLSIFYYSLLLAAINRTSHNFGQLMEFN